MLKPIVNCFFETASSTCVYIAHCPNTKKCAIIDSVLLFDAASGKTSTAHADQLIDFVRKNDLTCEWLLDTHVHADHITGMQYLQTKLGGRTAIGARIIDVQQTFKPLYNDTSTKADGSQWDVLWRDEQQFSVGDVQARVLYTPGHTPACVSYMLGDAVFVGDTLFMPDFGTARCDFPKGCARTLWTSVQRLLALDGDTRVFVGHDYAPGGRAHAWQTTVAEQKRTNKHVGPDSSQEKFVAMRTTRDSELGPPAQLLAALQVNINAGHLPPPEDNGYSYLRIPLNFPLGELTKMQHP